MQANYIFFSMYLFAIIVFLRLLKCMQIMPCQTISVFCPFDIGILCFLWHIDFIKDWQCCKFIAIIFTNDHWRFRGSTPLRLHKTSSVPLPYLRILEYVPDSSCQSFPSQKLYHQSLLLWMEC